MPVKILVADDHPIVGEGIRKEADASGMKFMGQVNSTRQIVDSIHTHRPDVLITEVRLGGHDALKAIEGLLQSENACRVVVFSAFSNPTHIARASALGCYDFIPKTCDCQTLMTAVNNAASGTPTPESSLLKTTRTRMHQRSSSDTPRPLTNRETQVLRHISMGLSNREIGKSLTISVETVKEHVQNILRKLDVNDRTQAAVWAIRKKMI